MNTEYFMEIVVRFLVFISLQNTWITRYQFFLFLLLQPQLLLLRNITSVTTSLLLHFMVSLPYLIVPLLHIIMSLLLD